MKTFATQLAIASALALPASAFAGGYTLPVHGLKPLSMGGASVATSRGADAIWYNPANIDETELSLEAALIALQASYYAPSGELGVENDAPMLPNPTLAFVWRATDRVSLGIAAYAPWSGQLRFTEDGPQRYAMVQNHESRILYLHLAGAIRLGNLRIGAGLQNVTATLKQRMVVSAYSGLFGWADDPELDVLTNLELSDPINITANAGFAYDAGPLTFAASIQLPFGIAGEATFQQRLPSSVFFDNVSVEGDRATMDIPFPLILRGGLAWKATDRVRFEAAATFEDWSVQQQLRIEPIGMKLDGLPAIGTYRLGPVILDRRMQDTISIHVGGELDLGKGVTLRSGFFYEPSAFSDETFSLAVPDDEKVGLGLGVSWRVGRFRLDAGLARIFQGERVVENSELRQVNPTNQSQALVIGNGTYETGYWLGGLGFAWTPPSGSDADLGEPKDTLDVSLE
jgi:long-chain fatty acid transport protein